MSHAASPPTLRVGILGTGSHSRLHHGPALAAFARRHPGRIERVLYSMMTYSAARRLADRKLDMPDH